MNNPTLKSSHEVFQFIDPNQRTGKCDLEIIRTGAAVICIASERKDNPAMSITNAIEYVVAQVVKQHALDVHQVIWIEHYPAQKGTRKESYDLATFKMTAKRTLTGTQWRPMTKDDWEEFGLKPRG